MEAILSWLQCINMFTLKSLFLCVISILPYASPDYNSGLRFFHFLPDFRYFGTGMIPEIK